MNDRVPVSPLHSCVVVVTGAQFGEVFDLVPDRPLTLGRGPGADAVLDDDTLAARHASVTASQREARLVDLGAPAGTTIDGSHITEASLRNGMRFWLGQHTALKFLAAGDVEAQYQRMLAESSRHEPLTGLHNRRHFRDRFSAEIAAAHRHGRPLSLLAIDVDNLGRVNEEHGVFSGDEVIKVVAFVLQGAIRKEDVLARVSGARFHILARETGAAGARALAERIRRAVERSRSSLGSDGGAPAARIGVTVSIGVVPADAGHGEQAILAAADRALARAKEVGHNTVAVEAPGGER